MLTTCEADARGRLGLEEKAYPQADYLRALLEAAQAVKPRELDFEGLEGPAIGKRIHDVRVAAIKSRIRAIFSD